MSKHCDVLYDVDYCETPTVENPLPPRIYNWIVRDRFRFKDGIPKDVTKEELKSLYCAMNFDRERTEVHNEKDSNN